MENILWYYSSGGKKIGPLSIDEMKNLYKNNVIKDTTLVWKNNMYNWQELSMTSLYNDIQ